MVKVSEVNRSPQPSSQDIGKQDDDDDDDIQGVLEKGFFSPCNILVKIRFSVTPCPEGKQENIRGQSNFVL